jgi:tetratricopeptide (TPR) repeat protein
MNRPFSLKTLFTITALLAVCATLRAEPADELIKNGDAFDQRFKSAEALECYLPAEKLEPRNASLLLRIARQYRYLMSDATSPKEKLRLGGIALDYSQRAAALAPNDSEAQLSVGITYGKMLPLMGTKEQVAASPRIKESAENALKLDPRNDTAWHVLGRWHRNVADVGAIKRALASALYGKLPTTTNEAAVACFEKAIKLNPNRLMHYIELGRVYAQMSRTADARRFLVKGLAMPDVEHDDPETKVRGREALAKLR